MTYSKDINVSRSINLKKTFKIKSKDTIPKKTSFNSYKKLSSNKIGKQIHDKLIPFTTSETQVLDNKQRAIENNSDTYNSQLWTLIHNESHWGITIRLEVIINIVIVREGLRV